MIRIKIPGYSLFAMIAFLCAVVPAFGQRGVAGRPASIEVDPPTLTLEPGESASVTATVLDGEGNAIPQPVLFLPNDPRSLIVDPDGRIEAYAPGRFVVMVRPTGGGRGGPRVSATIEVIVPFPRLERIEIEGLPRTLYSRSFIRPDYRVYDVEGDLRQEPLVFASSFPEVVSVDPYGQLAVRGPGRSTLRLSVGDLVEEIPLEVVANPIDSLELELEQTDVRTGDVVRFFSLARDAEGRRIEDSPVFYSFDADVDPESGGPPASGQIAQDGRFVAETPGRYTIVASAGGAVAAATIEVRPRNVDRRVTVVGRGPVREHHSSDLWVWEGVDGRDYAITGTWSGSGEAYIWDVTRPDQIAKIATIQVDARTVNDVKVSEDGRLAVITREGASNRRNGIVILDVSDPRRPMQIAAYDEDLTGGVHNAFIDQGYVYAINNGTHYDVIDIREPAAPYRVASLELGRPGQSVHDVWVADGIAYSSNWEDGVVLVDVGNGVAGGAPERPVRFASWQDPDGLTHAAFPFESESTGRSYLIVGDESFPNGLDPEGPTVPAGVMHVVDFTDVNDPVEVARFEVPEAGSHNMWVEDDILYAAFYNGGLRVVDLSGELMGDLYGQGREIAHFLPKDVSGVVPNESMVWGAQPYKGIIYLTDWNSGFWAVRLESP